MAYTARREGKETVSVVGEREERREAVGDDGA
jgi:hypothetical protein